MNNQDIIILILIFAILYLMYKTRNVESFTVSDDVNQAINDIYKADINAIRNLSNIATNIYNQGDLLTIPAKTTNTNDLIINGNITMNGNVNIVQFRGLIVIWSGAITDIPKGWALCDGQKYILDNNNLAIVDYTGTQTPDLRGRFILGSGQGTNLTNRVVNETGGLEKVTLTIDQMPVHSHSVNDAYFAEHSWPYNLGGSGDTDWDNGYYTRNINTGNTGGDNSHENMPPYYVLSYIMKL